MKIIKPILIISLVLIVSIVVLGWDTKNQYIPYPYSFKTSTQKNIKSDHNLVVIGANYGKYLNTFETDLRSKLSSNLTQLKILNLSADYHGLHRSINSLKNLEKYPPAVLYMGATQEYAEKKFYLKEYVTIKKNFKNFSNPKKASLIMLFPFLSQFFYSSVKKIEFGNKIIPADSFSKPGWQQKELELRFKIYETELQELIDLSFEKDIKLFLVVPPLDLEDIPSKTCSNSTSTGLERKLTAIATNLIKGDNKTALSELKNIKEVVVGNARYYYLLGRAHQNQGLFGEAVNYYRMANSYSCRPRGAHHILNSIIRKKAKENEVQLIDFDQMMTKDFGRNIMFKDNKFPQDIYFESFIEELSKLLNQYFKI